jgi:uncharacterized protein YukE
VSEETRLNRHYELWKQESTNVGRWVFGTLLFAAVVLLWVIEPYVPEAKEFAREERKLESSSAKQLEEKGMLDKTERLIDDVWDLYKGISGSPWQTFVDDLKRELERLGEAYRMLSDQSPTELAETLAQSPEPADDVDVSQVEQALRPLSSRAAADLLSLDAKAVGRMPPAEFALLLEQRLEEAAQKRADTTINKIAKLVENKVVGPLKELVEDSGQAELGEAFDPVFESLEEGMAKWTPALLADSDWYRTAERKDSVVRGLEKVLATYQRNFGETSNAERNRLKENIKTLAGRLQDIKAKIEMHNNEIKQLNEVLNTALPGWIRGLVSLEQVIQLYPPALVFLALVLVFKASTARHHFVTVRDHFYPDGAYWRDAALSSMWTLVYRGVTGTLVTAVTFVGCAVLLLLLFDWATDAALEWLAERPKAAWAHAEPWLMGLRPVGWTVMIGAACAAALALVVDGRAALRARART